MPNQDIPWDDDNHYSIAKLLGTPLVEDYNQNAVLGIIGRPGTGKSEASLRIAHDVSRYLAFKKGGKPEDYFTIDNIAIITEEEIIRVVKKLKKFNVYIFDDIGVGWNSRSWQSKGNKIMNKIAMTFRTQRNLLIWSVPDDEYIDKVPRHLLNYRIDMYQTNFKLGFTLGKFQELVRAYKNKQNYFPFVTNPSKPIKYVRAVFTLAPDHLHEAYKKRRESVQAKMQEKEIAELEHLFTDEPKEKVQKITKKDRIKELKRDVDAGVYDSMKTACNENNISYAYAKNVVADLAC